MATTTSHRATTNAGHSTAAAGRPIRLIGVLVTVIGILLAVAGAATWLTVQQALADEKITVADDAAMFAGKPVNGPLTAFAQAEIIEKHALEGTGGKTYAELDREDPAREGVMTGSFLRASLFTSVVAFGVAAMAFGLGVGLILIGLALARTARALN